jgi:hypothetical protein
LILLSAPIINPLLVFLAYIHISGQSLDAVTAFTTIALFNIMRFPFAFLPMGLLQFAQSKIALRRISKYLMLSELSSYVVHDLPPIATRTVATGSIKEYDDVLFIEDDEPPSDPAVVIINGTFSWIDPDATPAPVEPTKEIRMSRKEQRETKRKLKEEKEVLSGASSNSSLDILFLIIVLGYIYSYPINS